MDNNLPDFNDLSNVEFVIDFTDDGRIINVNDEFNKLLGYNINEINSGKLHFRDLVSDKNLNKYVDGLILSNKKNDSHFVMHEYKIKSGEIIHANCFVTKIYNEDNHECCKINFSNLTKIANDYKEKTIFKRHHTLVLENIPAGVVLCEFCKDELRIIEASDFYYHILGYNSAKEHPGTVGHMIEKEDLFNLNKLFTRSIETGEAFNYEGRLSRADGTKRWFRADGKYFAESKNGNPIICALLEDVSDAKRAQKQIFNQTARFKMIAENTEEVYFEYYVKDDILVLNNCINRYNDEDNIIKNYMRDGKMIKFVHPDDVDGYLSDLREVCSCACNGSLEYRTKAFDNDYTWYKMPYISEANEEGEVVTIYGRIYSIENLKNLRKKIDIDKAEIERLSTTDVITGLLNRKTFKKRVAERLQVDFDKDYCYGIVYSDINDFSYINDNFGFEAGNKALSDFSDVIMNLDTNIYGCRIYSDYYVGFYKANSRKELIDSIRIRNDLFTELQRKKYPASDIHISSGLYIITDRNVDVTIAMDNANLARRSVKGSKDVPCGIYTERMRKQRTYDQTIASELQSAIENGKIELFLQPKFSLDTREIIGAEALSRWKNNDGSYKFPHEFIDILENVGYVVDLDYYIFEQVLQKMARWKMEGKKLIPISVNFSRHHNNYKYFVNKLVNLTKRYGVDPNLLEIEITESCFAHDINVLFNNMKKLREHGFKIDIDDFGMGYSSLSVLLNAPIDIVKVDKVFIDDIGTSAKARDYVNQICNLIMSTDKEIIFEGVETERQAEILQACGYRMAQGWLFDKAIKVNEFESKYLCSNVALKG